MKHTKEIAKEIRQELKKEFPKFKFSVTSDYNSITVTLMEGPVSPFANDDQEGYEQLNHYYLEDDLRLKEGARKMLQKVNQIANRENYDNSDHMTDYFDVGFYFNLHIGKWDRPFKVVK